nr:MAG TPA: putative cytoplasmic protein [Caudoviricetes sp.]
MMYCYTEYCPECEREVSVYWDVEEDGYKIYCPSCGSRLMLCDACTHRGPNGEFCDDCDYSSVTDSCRFNPPKEEARVKVNCGNCAFCSESMSTFKDTCDLDNHVIKDCDYEFCLKFKAVEEGE